MNAPARIPTSLRHAPDHALTREELKPFRERAWIEQGLICLYPDEISNDFVRQGALNQMADMFGSKPMKRGN